MARTSALRMTRLLGRAPAPSEAEPSPQFPGHDARPDLEGRQAFLDRHVLIQTHIRKTGGSSLSAGLSGIVGGVHSMDVRNARSFALEHMTQAARDRLGFVSGHFHYGVHRQFNRVPLYFAAVRDPVERAVSAYRYTQRSARAEISAAGFARYWAENVAQDARNLQARVLMDARAGHLDQDTVLRRADEDYFLVIPLARMTDALHHLRAAFGVAWTRIAPNNVTRGPEVTPSPALAEEITRADALDAMLHAHISDTFDQRLARACDLIASHCLLPLKDANDGTGTPT